MWTGVKLGSLSNLCFEKSDTTSHSVLTSYESSRMPRLYHDVFIMF